MTHSLEDINAKVKAITARNPIYAEISQWVGDLLSATVEASKDFSLSDLKLEFDPLPEAWYQGKSLLNPEELSLDWKKISALYKRLVELVKKREDGLRQAEGLLKAIEKKRNGAPVLMKDVLASKYEAIEDSAKENLK